MEEGRRAVSSLFCIGEGEERISSFSVSLAIAPTRVCFHSRQRKEKRRGIYYQSELHLDKKRKNSIDASLDA